jgi:PAS domain S-box-containing protein
MENERLVRVLNIARDITVRKEMENKLKESEERYRLIYENANDLIRVLNDQFEFEYINEVVHKRILGYSKEDIIGQTHIPFLHPEDRRHAIRSTVRNLKKGEGSYQARFKDKEGAYKWFEFSGTIFYDSKGQKKILSIARDINERKKAEQKLKESEERYRLISETAYDLIGVLNKNFIYEYINESALKHLLGYSKEDLVNHSVLRFIHPDDLEFATIALQTGFKEGKGEAEIRLKHKDGHWVWFEVRGKTFLDKDGKLKALLVSRDFTERKEVMEKLRESEERYRLISQHSDENLFIFDLNLNLIYNDINVPNILGYSYEEMKQLKLSDYNTPESLKISMKAFREELRNERKNLKDPKRIRIFEIEQIHKNGSIINVETRFTFLRDEKGKATGMIGLSRNITKRKQAEMKLRESEEKYRLISETANDLIGVLNKKFKYEYINEQAFEKTLGYTSKDILGKSSIKFIHPDDVSQIVKTLFEGFKYGMGEGRLRFKHKDGHWVWIESKGRTYLDENGELKAIVISRDITERKRSEDALKKSEKKYREAYDRANFYKDLFAHDINNILQIVSSSSELISIQLGESEKSETFRNLTNIINQQVERGGKLVRNVHTLSKLEEETVIIKPIKIQDILKHSLEFVKSSYEDKDLQIKVDSQDKKLTVMSNALLQDVFENIIINSIKYNEKSKKEIFIRISKIGIDNQDYVKMEFIDNGIGVPDERKKIIFKRGNRALKGEKGMGLGLSLVSKIINNFKGQIWVEDRINGDYSKGSNFIILLPIAI